MKKATTRVVFAVAFLAALFFVCFVEPGLGPKVFMPSITAIAYFCIRSFFISDLTSGVSRRD